MDSGGEGYLEWEDSNEVTVKEREIVLQHFTAFPGKKLKSIQNVPSPQEMIKTFIQELKQPPCNCDAFNYFPADDVVGGNSKDRALAPVAKQATEELSRTNIEATDFEIQPDALPGDLVGVRFTLLFFNDDTGYELQQKDSIAIKLVTDGDGRRWKIVPQEPDFYLADFYADNLPPRKSTFTDYWASLMAHPREMQNGFYLYKSENQLEKLGKALFMCAQDYDGQVDFSPQQLKENLLPYAEEESLFTAPGDAAGFNSYSMNANIRGLNLQGLDTVSPSGAIVFSNRSSESVPSPHTLVMLYLGHDQKLNFNYGGYSVVCFMDGHVDKVTQEEAKNLRWKP
jgi:hypothetical protein